MRAPTKDGRWNWQRLEEILLEESSRAAYIEESKSIDGWDTWLYIVSMMDSTVTRRPLNYKTACLYYRDLLRIKTTRRFGPHAITW